MGTSDQNASASGPARDSSDASADAQSRESVSGARPKRRERYAGTHPRRFEQRYKEMQPERFPEMQAHIREQGRTPAGTHVPILLEELLESLAPQRGEIVADCTLGYGGHALRMLQRIMPGGRLVGLDIDARELLRAAERLRGAGFGIDAVHSSFAGLAGAMAKLEIVGFDMIYADLGLSSMQLDDPSRGFSHKRDGPLDMRMDSRIQRTAADWLNLLDADAIRTALVDFADEPQAAAIADAIVAARRGRPLSRTRELSEAVRAAYARWARQRRDQRDRMPLERSSADADESADRALTRTFQAVRMLVNDELSALRNFLRIAPSCLNRGGRLAIISFHSGEDRIVKHAFENGMQCGQFAEISISPQMASAQEIRSNPRSRSAKLRIARAPQ